MAIALKTSCVLAATKVSATASYQANAIFPATAIAVGDFMVVAVARDDMTADTATPVESLTDDKGNTWTRAVSTSGASAAGNVAHAVFYCFAAQAVTANTFILMTWDFNGTGTISAKAFSSLYVFTGVSSTTPVRTTGITNGTGTAVAASLGTVNAGELMFCAVGWEADSGNTYAGDADTTNGVWAGFARTGTTGSGGASNITVAAEYKIATATGAQTWNTTNSGSSDWRACFVYFQEAVIAGSATGTVVPVVATVTNNQIVGLAPDARGTVTTVVATATRNQLAGGATALPAPFGWGDGVRPTTLVPAAPDRPSFNIGQHIDVRMLMAMDDWSPTSSQAVLRQSGSAPNAGWLFNVNSAGTLTFQWSTTGSDTVTHTSSVATGFANGSTHWIRAVWDGDDGASGRSTKFYWSDNYDPDLDTGTWTQLGSTQTTAGVQTMFDSTFDLAFGSSLSAYTLLAMQLRSSDNGTIIASPDFRMSAARRRFGTGVIDAQGNAFQLGAATMIARQTVFPQQLTGLATTPDATGTPVTKVATAFPQQLVGSASTVAAVIPNRVDVLGTPATVGAAIVHDATTPGGFASGVNPTKTFAHTIGGGSNRLLVVGNATRNQTAPVTVASVKYNGVSLTRINSLVSNFESASVNCYLTEQWYMLEADLPPAGTYNVEVIWATGAVSIQGAWVAATSVSNVLQGPPEQSGMEQEIMFTDAGHVTGASQIDTLTTLTDDAWVFASVMTNSQTSATPTGDANHTQRTTQGSGSTPGFHTSTTDADAAGAQTLGWSYAGGSNLTRALMCWAAWAPVPTASTVNGTNRLGHTVGGTLVTALPVALAQQLVGSSSGGPATGVPGTFGVVALMQQLAGMAGAVGTIISNPVTVGGSWTPASLPSLAWWFTSDKGLAVTGTDITSWTDQGPNGYVVDAIPGNAPQTGRTLSGVPVVDFQANLSLDPMTLTSGGPTNSPATMFTWAVIQCDNIATPYETMWSGLTNYSPELRFGNNGDGKDSLLERGIAHHQPNSQTAEAVNTPYLIGMLWSGGNLIAWLNGVADGTPIGVPALAGTGTGFQIGGGGGSTGFDGVIASVGRVDGIPSPADLTRLWAYENAKFFGGPPAGTGATNKLLGGITVTPVTQVVNVYGTPGGAGAITHDVLSDTALWQTGTTPDSWSHTIGGGANRLLVVTTSQDGPAGSVVSGVTYNGVALTKVDEGQVTNSYGSLWYLLESQLPPVGTYTVVVSWAGAPIRHWAAATSVIGVYQGAPEATAKTTPTGLTSISTNITTLTPNAWVFDVVASETGLSWTAAAPQTQRSMNNHGSSSFAASTNEVASPGVTAMAWTPTGTEVGAVHILAAWAPAGGAGANGTNRLAGGITVAPATKAVTTSMQQLTGVVSGGPASGQIVPVVAVVTMQQLTGTASATGTLVTTLPTVVRNQLAGGAGGSLTTVTPVVFSQTMAGASSAARAVVTTTPTVVRNQLAGGVSTTLVTTLPAATLNVLTGRVSASGSVNTVVVTASSSVLTASSGGGGTLTTKVVTVFPQTLSVRLDVDAAVQTRVVNVTAVQLGGGITVTMTTNVVEVTSPTFYMAGGKVLVYDIAIHDWVAKPVMWWNGSVWAEKPMRYWTGTAWEPPPPTQPPALVAGLVGWWAADDPTTITETGGLVSALADKSTAGWNLTSSGAARPVTGAATMNGRNVLSFDSAQWLRSAALGSLFPYGLTFVAVLRKTGADALYDSMPMTVTVGNQGSPFDGYNANRMLGANGYVPGPFTNVQSMTTPTLLTGVVTVPTANGVYTERVNNGAPIVGTTVDWADAAAQVFTLGSRADGVTGLRGVIAEVCVYAHTAALPGGPDVTAVRDYLRTKWGTP